MGELGKTMGSATVEQQPIHTRRGFLDRFLRRPAVARVAVGLACALGITSESVLAAPLPEVNQQTLPLSARIKETDPQKILQLTGLVLSELGKAYHADTDPLASDKATEVLGLQISNAYQAADGFGYIWFQRGAIQFKTNGNGEFEIKPRLWNTLEEMHKAGFDSLLENQGAPLGVTIPRQEEFDDKSNGDLTLAFKNRIEHFQIPPHIDAFVQNIRKTFETSAYSSKGKTYGPYTVYRTHRIAVQEWTGGPNKGLIQLILVGDAAKKAGFIPQEVQLKEPLKINFATGGVNGNGNGVEGRISTPTTIEFPVNLGPVAERYGDLERDGFTVENYGTKIRLTVTDLEYAKQQSQRHLLESGKRVKVMFYDREADIPADLKEGGFINLFRGYTGPGCEGVEVAHFFTPFIKASFDGTTQLFVIAIEQDLNATIPAFNGPQRKHFDVTYQEVASRSISRQIGGQLERFTTHREDFVDSPYQYCAGKFLPAYRDFEFKPIFIVTQNKL